MSGGKGYRRLRVSDFDGTLSPIVPGRGAAGIHPACRDLLRVLASEPGQLLAVLSSRAPLDRIPRVPVSGVLLSGGSGIECRGPRGHRMGMGNDAVAMRWVLARKGTAFAVGGRARVPWARGVGDPASLARAVRAFAEISAASGGAHEREEARA